MKKIASRFFTWEFIRFLIIGVINTFSTTVFASIFDKRINDKLAFVLGYVLGMVISFFLNTYFTFRERPTWDKAIKFPLTVLPNFIFKFLFVWLYLDVIKIENIGLIKDLSAMLSKPPLDFSRTFAYLCAAVIALPLTFLFMRFFIYKKK